MARESTQSLLSRHEALKRMHLGSTDKSFRVCDQSDQIYIKDKRLNDLLWQLQLEAYQEISDRFPPLPEGTI